MNRIFVTILIYFAVTSLNAQLLYKISGNGLEKESYIFAIHPRIPISHLNQIPTLFKAYNDCETVVGETVIDDVEAMKRITHEAIMPDDIRDILGDKDFSLLDSALKIEIGISANEVRNMRPAMIQNMYVMSVYERLLPELKDFVGMDAFFQSIAEEQGIPVVGLENVEEQVDAMFRTQSIARQAESLVSSIKASSTFIDDYNTLKQQYLSGNIAAIYKDFNTNKAPHSMTEGERFLFITSRSLAWVDKIDNLIKQKPCFIAVDVLHFTGNDGLIELLKKKGYKVKPVK